MGGCSVAHVAGTAVGVAGKTVYTTARIVCKTAELTGKGAKTVVNMASGRHIVRLARRGTSLTTGVLLNRRVMTDLIIDTGAGETVISAAIARKLGIRLNNCRTVQCQVADGRTVNGRQVNIREVKVGGARVSNVQAVVLDSEEMGNAPGLLGMSFLDNFVFKIDTEKQLLVLQKR